MMGAETQARAYTDHLRKREDHAPDRERYLQLRVAITFQRLTLMFANRTLGPRILDLGVIGDGFSNACVSLGCGKVRSIGIVSGVDFERDRLPVEDASFDTVCATSLIEHLADPSNMLSEAYRVLDSHGLFILVTPHWPWCWREFWDAYTHKVPYSHKSMRAALETHGFEVLALVPWMVGKSDMFWRMPAPWSFRLAARLLFDGLDQRPWILAFLKGRSRSLLALARKP